MTDLCSVIQRCLIINYNYGISTESIELMNSAHRTFDKHIEILDGVIIDLSQIDLLDKYIIEDVYKIYRTYQMLVHKVVICGCDTADIITFVDYSSSNIKNISFSRDISQALSVIKDGK